MNTIAPAIKRRRVQMGLTQREMAEKMHLSEKAWQNIENGVIRMDMERLKQIAEVLEIALLDLINSQETMYINQVDRGVGYANEVNNPPATEVQKELYEQLLAEKDDRIRFLMEENTVIKKQMNELIDKLIKD